MSNEEKILAMLEKMQGNIETMQGNIETMQADIGAIKQEQALTNIRLDKVESRLDKVEADVHQAKEDAHWTRVRIESKIEPNIQLLAEGDAAIVERMATKEQLEELREDLGLERYRIDVLAERQRRAK